MGLGGADSGKKSESKNDKSNGPSTSKGDGPGVAELGLDGPPASSGKKNNSTSSKSTGGVDELGLGGADAGKNAESKTD